MNKLLSVEEMAEVLGMSSSTFKKKFIPLIDRENAKRSVKNKLYLSTGKKRITRRFDPDRVCEFLLSVRAS